MALFSAVDAWMESVDKGHFVGALLLDFTKAFDSVPHQLLLKELQSIWCSKDTITWFCNYLTDRQQRVVTYKQVTEWMMVSRGFPQGPCISPLHFNIFVKRLLHHFVSSTHQFSMIPFLLQLTHHSQLLHKILLPVSILSRNSVTHMNW